ncbi:MAG TPA: 30S ribosomal protein S6 [Pirellulaceae bacterium]|nr:30S ribosomal protein S6 [Pirellulaceae bacterium]
MATNVYETMFILDSNRYARDPGAVSGTVAEIIQKFEGEVLVSRLWNEQKLAYPIDGHRKGTYWLAYFQLDSSKLVEFNRALQLTDSIVRSLTVKVDPRLVEPLVSHARGAKSMIRTEAPPVRSMGPPIEVPEEVNN